MCLKSGKRSVGAKEIDPRQQFASASRDYLRIFNKPSRSRTEKNGTRDKLQVCQAGQTGCNHSYTQVADTYNGTTAKILSGTNGSTTQDFDGRSFLKTVDTGWANYVVGLGATASNVLTLWGMADLGSARTDVYTLSLSYDSSESSPNPGNGSFGLATKDAYGAWVNAVDMNKGTFSKRFVLGPWNSSYDLGTYGVDTNTNTAWELERHHAECRASA